MKHTIRRNSLHDEILTHGCYDCRNSLARRDTAPHSTRMGEPSNDNDTMLLGGQPAALAVALQGFERLEVAAASARAVADGLLRRDVGALRRSLRPERALAVGVDGAPARYRRRPPQAIRTEIGDRLDVVGASPARGRRAPKMGLH